MTNCPNCGAPIEPYKCKCGYCGTWYFDFTSFDMGKDVPYYVKFKTPYGIITTLAKPELRTIDINEDNIYVTDAGGVEIGSFVGNRSCDLGVIFHSYVDPEKGTLFEIKTEV